MSAPINDVEPLPLGLAVADLLAALHGFEPRQADPESAVLPLHNRASSLSIYSFNIQNFDFEFKYQNIEHYTTKK